MRFDRLVKAWRIVVTTGSAVLSSTFADLFGGIFFGAATGGVITALVQAASIAIDASLGNDFVVTLTTNVAFILANPTNPPPAGFCQEIRITVVNASGAPHGAGTFGTLYKVSATPITAIATGFNRTLCFRWNGTNWVEIWQTATDVAN